MIKYAMSKGHEPTKEDIKVCDEGRKGFQSIIVETAKIAAPKYKFVEWLAWLWTRFYKRTITKESISYDFYLFPTGEKKISHKIAICKECGKDGFRSNWKERISLNKKIWCDWCQKKTTSKYINIKE